ncbi:sugar kinase [Lacicoccus alkaliphilus]|uniref:2-dehydro-3-deoxygluconokinase n=1 Tax=Lacicoccus alkaliphilus DSM 16010 TaxID=1123231 RepID=A0A1M7D0A3_9BACL|nr:sugar kinase [Salinicoccus alkaliphilus]SHL72855.1 2-dehydro-3-deoxygluconokinase [Salinicoccus alkaliphilus DSM 16010]
MKFITFGEIMMRLSTETSATFKTANQFNINIGGSEMNVAMSLAASDIDTSMITALPDNGFGQRTVSLLKSNNINTEHINMQGARMGTYFLEQGFNLRPSAVIYDRKYSSFEQSSIEDYDFESIFEGRDWFHFSGITPALNLELQAILLEALKAAKSKGMTVSADLNFRGNLWSFEEARRTMPQFIHYCDVIFGYEPLELIEDGTDIKDGLERNPDADTLKPILEKISNHYKIKHIAFTQRTVIHSNKNIIKGMMYTDGGITETESYEVDILDRIGTGDAYTAGIIHGLMNNLSHEETIKNALGNMLYKHTISGDFLTEDISGMHTVLDATSEVKR